jgi:hypothetical protein
MSDPGETSRRAKPLTRRDEDAGDAISERQIRLRLLAAILALGAGLAAVIVAILLVRSVLG